MILRDHIAIARKAADTRRRRGVRSGHKKKADGTTHEGTLRTRLRHLLATISRACPWKMIPLDPDMMAKLAETLECAPQTLRKATMDIRKDHRSLTDSGIVIVATHEKSEDCPRGRWQLWVIGRYHTDKIYALPGAGRRLRWHQRKGSHQDWQHHGEKLARWGIASIKKRSDGKHKGVPMEDSAPPAGGAAEKTKDLPAWRRFRGSAAFLEQRFRCATGKSEADIFGWMLNRLKEEHSEDAILESVIHAYNLLPKRRQTSLKNEDSWMQHVASTRLQADGLLPRQRRMLRLKKAAPDGAAFKVVKIQAAPQTRPASARANVIDQQGKEWKHLGGTHWEPI